MIDALHARPEGTAGRQFRSTRARFVEGVDCFEPTSDEIRRMSGQGVLPERTARAVLLTARGYLKVVRGFNDDRSWALHDASVRVSHEGAGFGRCLSRAASVRAASLVFQLVEAIKHVRLRQE